MNYVSVFASLKHGDHDQSDHGNWANGGGAAVAEPEIEPIVIRVTSSAPVPETRDESVRPDIKGPVYRSEQAENKLHIAQEGVRYTPEEIRDGIKGYVGTPDSFAINEALRQGREPEPVYAKTVEKLDAAIARGAVPENVLTYRRAYLDPDHFEAGDEFIDRGYVSTAVTMDKFQSNRLGAVLDSSGRETILMEITVPKGTPALYVPGLPTNHQPDLDENELVLGRNQRFHVDAVSRESRKTGYSGEMRDLTVVYLTAKGPEDDPD